MQIIFLNYMFSTFLYTERKLFGLSSKTLRRGCNHRILRVHRNVLKKNKKRIFRKKSLSLFFARRLQGKIRRGGQHCLHWDNSIFMQTIFLKYTFFLPILYFERNSSGLSSKTFRRVCNHSILRVYRTVLRKNKKWILRKKYKYSNILGDCEEKLSGVVKTAFTETIGSLCRSFFWNIGFFTIFVLWAKNFQLFVENSSARL